MHTHRLKTWPEFFNATLNGEKKFEVRRDDRGFSVGDELILCEWDPNLFSIGGHTHREIITTIIFKLPGGKFGIDPNYCILGIGDITEEFN